MEESVRISSGSMKYAMRFNIIFIARADGSAMRAWNWFQPSFLAVEAKLRMTAKSSAPSCERKPPEIFWRSFIMRTSRSSASLVKGTAGSDRKRKVPAWRA